MTLQLWLRNVSQVQTSHHRFRYIIQTVRQVSNVQHRSNHITIASRVQTAKFSFWKLWNVLKNVHEMTFNVISNLYKCTMSVCYSKWWMKFSNFTETLKNIKFTRKMSVFFIVRYSNRHVVFFKNHTD